MGIVKWIPVMGTILGLTLALAPQRSVAQTIKRESAKQMSPVDGAANYQAYCAVCHGPQGKGNGPAAKALKTPPPDVTVLAKKNGGKFSQSDVEAAILGTRELAPHGTQDMPVWGPVFRALDTQDAMAKLRLQNLVQFIRSIQVP